MGSWLNSSWMSPRDGMSWSKEQRLKEQATGADGKILQYLNFNTIHAAVTKQERRGVFWRLKYGVHTSVLCNQIKPRMVLVTTAISSDQLPLPRLPEIAFVGRSNVGKSTLVNYITGNLSKGYTSFVPGSTKELHFWMVGKPSTIMLVDMPGFGFAEATEAQRLQWTEFSLQYLRTRKNLKRVFMLIDARRWLRPADREMLAFLDRHEVKWQVVVTKCDLVRKKELARRISLLKEELAEFKLNSGQIFPVTCHKQGGMVPLRKHIDRFRLDKQVVKDGIKVRVTDALELRRLQKADKRQRKREAELEKQREKECLDPDEAESTVSCALSKWGLPKTKREESKTSDLFCVDDVFGTREGRRILDIAMNLYHLEHLRMPSNQSDQGDLSFGSNFASFQDDDGGDDSAVSNSPGLLTGLFDKVGGKNKHENQLQEETYFDDNQFESDSNSASSGVEFDFSGQKTFFQPKVNNALEFDFRSSSDSTSSSSPPSISSQVDAGASCRLEAYPPQQQNVSKEFELSFDMRVTPIPSQAASTMASSILQGLQGVGADGSAPVVPEIQKLTKVSLKHNADALTLRLANTKEAIEQREQYETMYHVDDLASAAEVAAGFRTRTKKPEDRSDLEDFTHAGASACWRTNLVEEDPLQPLSGFKTHVSNKGDGFGTELHSGITQEGQFPSAVGKIITVRRRRKLQKTRRVISPGTCDATATGFIQLRNVKEWKDVRGASIKAWQIKGKPLIKQGQRKKTKDITDIVRLKEERAQKTYEEMRKKWKAWARKKRKAGRHDIVTMCLPPRKQAFKSGYSDPTEKDPALSTLAQRKGLKSMKSHRSKWDKRHKDKKVTMF